MSPLQEGDMQSSWCAKLTLPVCSIGCGGMGLSKVENTIPGGLWPMLGQRWSGLLLAATHQQVQQQRQQEWDCSWYLCVSCTDILLLLLLLHLAVDGTRKGWARCSLNSAWRVAAATTAG